MSGERIVIGKVWRSELPRLLLIIILLVVAPILSRSFPGSVITGELFTLFSVPIYLSLPLWWLLPASLMVEAAWRVYNVRYVIDDQGVESWNGILSLRQQITQIRHEDVRSIETDQSVLERILDVGEVLIGTAATGDVEVTFQGVANPKKLQNWLLTRRDKVQKKQAALRSVPTVPPSGSGGSGETRDPKALPSQAPEGSTTRVQDGGKSSAPSVEQQ